MLIFLLLGAVAVASLGLVCPLVLPYLSLPCILAAPLAAASLAVAPLSFAPLAAASIYSWLFL